jgi:hypothetical protein
MTQPPGPYAEFASGPTFEALAGLQAIATSRGTSMTGLALAWLLADDRVAQIVIGLGRPNHLASAAEALEHPVTGQERARSTRQWRPASWPRYVIQIASESPLIGRSGVPVPIQAPTPRGFAGPSQTSQGGINTPPTQRAISASRSRWVTGGWSVAGEGRGAGGAAGV